MKTFYRKIKDKVLLEYYLWVYRQWFKALARDTKLALLYGTVRQIQDLCDVWITLGKTQEVPHIVERAEQWKDNASQIVMRRVSKR